jgi:hypothetical protein
MPVIPIKIPALNPAASVGDSDLLVIDNSVDTLKITFAAFKATLAVLESPNVFGEVNTFNGLRVGIRTVTSDFLFTATDYEVLADASSGQISGALPPALGTGQIFRAKKIDSSVNPVLIICQPGDTINADSGEILAGQFDGIILIDSAAGQWDNVSFIAPFTLPPNVALRDQANIFSFLNTFTGVRFATRTVTSDFIVTEDDFEILVDATAGAVTGSLPASIGSGQYIRVKKIDTTANIVTIAAAGADLIDGSISLNFSDQYADCSLIDAAPGYWDNSGSDTSGGGGGADFGVNGRVVDLFPIKGFSFEVFDGSDWIEQTRYTEPSSSPPPTTDVSDFYEPAITDLAGLKAWPTVGNLTNSRLTCLYGAGSNVSDSYAVYLLRTGAADGGDPGQVSPDDYDAGTNNVHWEQKV